MASSSENNSSPTHRADDETFTFTEAMHIRCSLLTDAPKILQAAGFAPSNEHEGMLSSTTADAISSNKAAPAPPSRPRGGIPSASFRRGESETIQKVLQDIDLLAKKRIQEGMSEVNFTVGVLNAFFVCYVFGRFPEHFWLLYAVETIILIPTKFYYMVKAKPLNEALYYLDLCFFLNFVGMLALTTFAVLRLLDISAAPTFVRKQVYLTFMAAACGPLLGASFLLPFVSFLFHDVRTMTGLFIHILPPMVAFTFLWHGDQVREAWPMLFQLNYLDDVHFFPESGPYFIPGVGGLGTVAGNGIAVYVAWFIPYVTWMVTIGLDLPRTTRRAKGKDGQSLLPRYDTVFHSTVRGGLCMTFGKLFWNRPKETSVKQMETNDYELRDFVVYMLIHATLAIASIYVLAYACYANKHVHMSLLVALIVICVHRGSKRYTYYSTTMYGRLVRQRFENQMMNSDRGDKSKGE
jgi:Protein of unknown function (DUF2838)